MRFFKTGFLKLIVDVRPGYDRSGLHFAAKGHGGYTAAAIKEHKKEISKINAPEICIIDKSLNKRSNSVRCTTESRLW
ncbi:hypothetical protein BIV59_18100 [Bacillus sp. MUM 13]|nr:hypothetical protein BIV59_18100 [Bacillus sp. MUM 13]